MDYFFLKNTAFFHGIREEELEELVNCLNAREQHFNKDEVIMRAGSPTAEIGMVESGSVNIVVNFYWGSSSIFGHVEKGQIFAENYAAIPRQELLCDVVAAEECNILFFNMGRVSTICGSNCAYHNRLIQNLLSICARKNLGLSTRMMHIAPKAIRNRLLSYLSWQALENESTHFFIPYNRQQLAEYLGVDRSALSNELSKMQKDGLIKYHKNEFKLMDYFPE